MKSFASRDNLIKVKKLFNNFESLEFYSKTNILQTIY